MKSAQSQNGPEHVSSDTATSGADDTAAYARLSEVPADLLANRLTCSLIMQKGNLNQYDAVLQRFIENTRAEAVAERAELLEALRPFAEKLADIGEDEADDDAFRDMSPEHRRAPRITVGHLRRARAAITKAGGQS